MKLAYVAMPYRSPLGSYGIVRNIRAAETVALELWAIGLVVLCPHTNCALFDGAPGTTDETWLEGDLVILERCDLVVMGPGWETSSGARAEREYAELRGIPVYEWPVDASALAALAVAGGVE